MAAKTRSYLRWRMDQDYRAKLTPAQRAWLDRFNDDHYRKGYGTAERFDVVTAGEDQVAGARRPARACCYDRYYEPEDFDAEARQGAGDVEAELVELCDRTRRVA